MINCSKISLPLASRSTSQSARQRGIFAVRALSCHVSHCFPAAALKISVHQGTTFSSLMAEAISDTIYRIVTWSHSPSAEAIYLRELSLVIGRLRNIWKSRARVCVHALRVVKPCPRTWKRFQRPCFHSLRDLERYKVGKANNKRVSAFSCFQHWLYFDCTLLWPLHSLYH